MQSGSLQPRGLARPRDIQSYRQPRVGYVSRGEPRTSLPVSQAVSDEVEVLSYDLPVHSPQRTHHLNQRAAAPKLHSGGRTAQSFDMIPIANKPTLATDTVEPSSEPAQFIEKALPTDTTQEMTPISWQYQTYRPRHKTAFLLLGEKIASMVDGMRANRQRSFIYVMASFVFISGIGVSAHGFFVNSEAEAQVKAVSTRREAAANGSSQAEDQPSEVVPTGDEVNSYMVAASAPRMLSIPSLGINARVIGVGVDENNELQTPKNIHDTAWYVNSAEPGKPGAMLINGHSSGISAPGVFKDLKLLHPGDSLTIERGDRTTLSYTIKRVATVTANRVDMASLLVSVDSTKPGLNLITCGGKFDKQKNQFEDRVLVYAVQN